MLTSGELYSKGPIRKINYIGYGLNYDEQRVLYDTY